MANSHRKRTSSVLLLKEGFLFKRGEIIKKWMKRYCVLNPQCLCYFKKQAHSEEVEPLGRVFLDDIINIDNEVSTKKKPFCFALHTDNAHKRKTIYFHASNEMDKLAWTDCIKNAKEKERRAERDDPFRKTLKKLTKGLKRIKLEKDPDKGIGCTIKNAAGVILVSRIIEDGPIAATGVLKPGDEILDIHGTTVTGKSVEEIVQIIRDCPDGFLATVRPVVSIRKPNDPQIIEGLRQKTNYSELVFSNDQTPDEEPPDEEDIKEALECVQDDLAPSSPSPPPIPPHTKESYILLEPVSPFDDKVTRLPSNEVVDVIKRRPHIYEEIDLECPVGKTSNGNGRILPTAVSKQTNGRTPNASKQTNGRTPDASKQTIGRTPDASKQTNGRTPDALTYADLDFRQ